MVVGSIMEHTTHHSVDGAKTIKEMSFNLDAINYDDYRLNLNRATQPLAEG